MRILLGTLAALAALALVGWFVVIPVPRGLDTRNPERTALMEQRLREARAAGATFEVRQEWVPLDRISRTLVRAVIVAEDHRFREHRGIDWRALSEEVRWEGGGHVILAEPRRPRGAPHGGAVRPAEPGRAAREEHDHPAAREKPLLRH